MISPKGIASLIFLLIISVVFGSCITRMNTAIESQNINDDINTENLDVENFEIIFSRGAFHYDTFKINLKHHWINH